LLTAVPLAVTAPRPAAEATHAVLQLFPGPADAALAGGRPFGVLDQADELVAGQRGDVVPGGRRAGAGYQPLPQALRQLMHDAAGKVLSATDPATTTTVSPSGRLLRPDEVTEEKGDHEDDQQDLGEHEEDDADPEADTDFLFEVHAGATLSRKPGGGPDLNLRSGDRRNR
jgi:hypothetical protein